MICETCRCFCGEFPHEHALACLDALLAWRKEADARLIEYEQNSVIREKILEEYRDVVDGLGGDWTQVENKHA